jgi:hypothetical protein
MKRCEGRHPIPDSAAPLPATSQFPLVPVHTFTDDDVVEPSGGQPGTKIDLPQEVRDPGDWRDRSVPNMSTNPSSRCGDSSQFVVSGCLGSSELHSVDAHHSVRPVAIQPGRREVPHLEGGSHTTALGLCIRLPQSLHGEVDSDKRGPGAFGNFEAVPHRGHTPNRGGFRRVPGLRLRRPQQSRPSPACWSTRVVAGGRDVVAPARPWVEDTTMSAYQRSNLPAAMPLLIAKVWRSQRLVRTPA